MAEPPPGFELPRLLFAGFRSLIDELHAELARQGHPDVRPAYGFAMQAIGRDGSNVMRYRNPEVDRLIVEAAAQPDLAGMKSYLDQIQQIMHREQPVTFLWESKRLTAINKRVKNAKPTPNYALFNLKEWWIEPARP